MSSVSEQYHDYLRGPGFAIVDDIGMQVIHEAEDIDPVRIATRDIHLLNETASIGFVNVARQLHSQFYNRFGGELPHDLTTKFGFRPEDHTGNPMLLDGLTDQDFTWHFAPPVANAAADALVAAGDISLAEKKALTVKDYANLIGSGWFSNLIHNLALTRNGLYGNFGQDIDAYEPNGLSRQLSRAIGSSILKNMFTTQTERETDELGITIDYKTIALSQSFKMALRAQWKANPDGRGSSTGCPVARHSGTLPIEIVHDNPHIQSLVSRGQLQLDEPTNGKVRFYQEKTPIDYSLQVLAQKLDQYAELYGDPFINEDAEHTKDWRGHHRVQPTNVLWNEVNIAS